MATSGNSDQRPISTRLSANVPEMITANITTMKIWPAR
jgi:hypothetical protein